MPRGVYARNTAKTRAKAKSFTTTELKNKAALSKQDETLIDLVTDELRKIAPKIFLKHGTQMNVTVCRRIGALAAVVERLTGS